ncbi:hypothetical protein ACFXG4_47520 [Nocardia sp. NPDC059246]|uniref:hypothetical protein n=1 Tax=unclassified Nocardia TaxID=2637762 RepID=UPI0036A6608C
MPRHIVLMTALLVLASANLSSALAPPLLMTLHTLAAFTPTAAAALIQARQRACALTVVVGGPRVLCARLAVARRS